MVKEDKMTVFEEYKQSIAGLIDRLESVSCWDDIKDTIALAHKASTKIKEMLQIIENVGIANGVMANALQIMIKG